MVQYKKNGKEAPARSTSTPKKRLMAVNPSPNNIPASRTNIAGQICGKDAHYGIFIIKCKYQRPATVRMRTTPNVQIHDNYRYRSNVHKKRRAAMPSVLQYDILQRSFTLPLLRRERKFRHSSPLLPEPPQRFLPLLRLRELRLLLPSRRRLSSSNGAYGSISWRPCP